LSTASAKEVVSSKRPCIGFVLERSLGHVTHADNIQRMLAQHSEIDAAVMEIPYDVEGWSARVPVFKSNWTVRAGLRAARSIVKTERRTPLDALFVHTQVPAVLAMHWIKKIPSIVSLDATPMQYDELGLHYGHQVGPERVERLKWRANRESMRRARHIITWSDWAKHGVVEGYGIDVSKVSVVPPGVTPSMWLNPNGGRPTDGVARILFVGGDLERKGGDLLLRVFARLHNEIGDRRVELHLVTHAEVPPAPGVTVHCGLEPNSAELMALYHRSDVFCLPTRGDCLPMVLSEAGAAGLPLVSTAVAAIPEIVRDDETGLIVPIDDENALLHTLRRLVDDASLRRRLGDGASRLVRERFDADKNVATLVEMLVDVAGSDG
jgi:glycosyltransferase involved in cell wall biosynthesis